MMKFLTYLRNLGISPEHSQEEKFRRSSLLLISVLTSLCGIIWGTIYFFLYGFSRHAILPWSFAVIVGSAAISFIVKKDYKLLSISYLFCILTITAAIQFSLGGLVASGTVMFWTVLAIVLEDYTNLWAVPASSFTTKLFFSMNIIGPSFTIYFGMKYFVDAFYREHNAVQIERAKSDALLLNILPEETAQELKETGSAKPKHYELITVLFTDFKGFTQIAERLTPAQVIEELNHCFSVFDSICEKYGLEKIKTIGDSYMCAGGLPVANTSNPIDVVSAGLEMQECLQVWKKEKEAKNEPVWELRVGIHSGEAVAGVVGKNKFAYDIWGDTVNLASRMESSGEAGKVNISETTYHLIKHKFKCTFRGAVKAKNKGEVNMYFVDGLLSPTSFLKNLPLL